MPFEKKGTLKLRCGHLIKCFRQNNDFFRLTLFPLWISSDVVRFWVFVVNRKFFYNCKNNMQVLTGQYPKLYTHKFRLFYTDFIPTGVRDGFIFFLTLKPTYEVLVIKVKQQTLFTGPSTPVGNILIAQEGFGTFAVPSTMVYVSQRLNQDINPTSGSLVAANLRSRQFTTPVFNIIADQSNPYQIGCYLIINSGSGTAALTGGSIDVWVTTMKMP